MSSALVRGKDTTLMITDETGKRIKLLAKDIRITFNMSHDMAEHIGDPTPSSNPDFNGINIGITAEEDDTTVIDLQQELAQRAFDRLPPKKYTISARQNFRKQGVRSITETYSGCVFITNDRNRPDQKSFNNSTLDAYCKTPPKVIRG